MSNILSKIVTQGVQDNALKCISLSYTDNKEQEYSPFLCTNLTSMLFVSHKVGSMPIVTISNSD